MATPFSSSMTEPATTLERMLLRHEDLRLKPYRDSVGKLTIGIGHNLDDNGISKAAAYFIFREDISAAINGVLRALPWISLLDEIRRAVLYNMAFNLGVSGLLGFKRMLAALDRKDYEEAAREMLDSKWAVQVGSRADELANMLRTGKA